MTNYLTAKNLNFCYPGGFQALYDINLSFEKNTTTTIIGPSGSGKSTLLRTFNRIYELGAKFDVSGEIIFEEQNILDDNIDLNILRQKIGMVFQKPTPFPMTIFENIAFALRLHKKLSKSELKENVEKALKQAALWDEVKDKLHNAGSHLSGGQQQRLCIARTIAIEPDVLLLDEPTSSLDPISTAKIEELIQELEQQYSIIMVTHNLKQAKRLGKQTVFMADGKIIEKRPTEELFANPHDELTKRYIEKH